jgi:hypothetical protein
MLRVNGGSGKEETWARTSRQARAAWNVVLLLVVPRVEWRYSTRVREQLCSCIRDMFVVCALSGYRT